MEEKMMYDFTSVSVEVEFEKVVELDISKIVANAVHQNTSDLGIDEIAREVYRNGKAEMNAMEAREFQLAVANSRDLLISIKTAVKKTIEK
jgi:hypothetical protein